MKNVVLIFALVALLQHSFAQVTTEARQFFSTSLNQTRTVVVHKPDSISATSPCPVLIFLPGWTMSPSAFNLFNSVLASLLNSNQVRPMLIVVPDGSGGIYSRSFFWNSNVNGKHGDYIVRDLVEWIKQEYPVKHGRRSWILGGFSMGGGGCARLALASPDVFSGFASFSGDILVDRLTEMFQYINTNENPNFIYTPPTSGKPYTYVVWGFASAFSPDSTNPYSCQFPLVEGTGQLRDSVFASWRRGDGLALARQYFIVNHKPADSMNIYIRAGSNDPNISLFSMSRDFSDSLTSWGITHNYGTHSLGHNFNSALASSMLLWADSLFRIQATSGAGWTVQNSGVSNILYTVKAVDQNVGWAAGLGGTVIRTVNGGNLWRSVGSASIPGIYSIDAIDSNNAVVAASTTQSGGNTYIYGTTNGGVTWTQVYSLVAPGAFIDCVRMLNTNFGVAVGDPLNRKWVVLKTTNGGAAWVPTPTQPDQIGSEWGAPHMIFLLSETDIRFVAGNGSTRIYRSTDGGSTWSNYLLPFGGNYSLSLCFNGPQVGISGSSTTSIARTTDGGVTWSPSSLPGSGTWGLTGYDTTFYAVNWATIYVSTDNGMNWSQSYAPGFGQLSDISFVKRSGVIRGWAIGGYGSIAAYYGSVTSVDNHSHEENPVSIKLNQNYPNPFNPSTTIRYALPTTSRVSLKVYDVLGREVATLVDEEKAAGEYKVQFGANNVASGVYFYRLQAAGSNKNTFVETKKLILVK